MVETTLPNPSQRKSQLSFNVGLPGQSPDIASIKVGGSMPVHRDIQQGEKVQLRITDMDGQVLVSYECECEGVAFKTKKDKYGDVESIERLHTIAAVGLVTVG